MITFQVLNIYIDDIRLYLHNDCILHTMCIDHTLTYPTRDITYQKVCVLKKLMSSEKLEIPNHKQYIRIRIYTIETQSTVHMNNHMHRTLSRREQKTIIKTKGKK